MNYLLVFIPFQFIPFASVETILLPVLAGLSVLYIGLQLFKKNTASKLVLDTPTTQESIATFLQAFFSGTWDSIETGIELDYFKTKIIQGDAANLRELASKLFVINSPYCLPGNRNQLNVLINELALNAFINQELISGTPQQKEQAIQFALKANNREALPFLKQLVGQQARDIRLQTLKVILQLSDLQPVFFNSISEPLSNNEVIQLLALYADKTSFLDEQINTWLSNEASPQKLEFCLLLAKQYEIVVDSRRLQFLGFHQDKKIGALAIELLDGYLLQNQASDTLQHYRKTTLLQHKDSKTTADSK